VIPIPLARRLVAAGLTWDPAPGDRFCIPDKGMDDEVFVLSTMTIEVHDLPGRTVIGFNGTTEWALDDVDKDAALWLPREDQLRAILGEAFIALQYLPGETPGYAVSMLLGDTEQRYVDVDVESAYARAALALLRSTLER
jgi:hypothetical protein